MATNYDTIAGRSLGRLTALSDGVFSIAMTLLVLDLRVPALAALQGHASSFTPGALRTEQPLIGALIALAPRLITYLLSFMTLGIFWLAQQAQLDQCARADRRFSWWQLAFLCAVAAMPFSTSLLSEYIGYRSAVIVYWLDLFAMGATLWMAWQYARQHELLREDMPAALGRTLARRIVTYQSLYAMSALVCVISTYLSVALLVLLQLNSVLAPRLSRPNTRSL